METAVGYARVSSRSQEDNSSLESQMTAIRAFALENDIELVREVKEVFSGSSLFDRPLLNQIRDEIRAEKYDYLIVYDVDRLSRDMVHLAILLSDCERFNTQLKIVQGDFENSLEGRFLFSMKGYLAESERIKTIERTTRGRRAKATAQTLSYKRKLFGYYLDDDGKRQIDAKEAETVKRIFALFIEGNSLRQIAAELNSEGITTPKGKLWFARSVQVILNNPAFSGRTYAFREKEVYRYVQGNKKKQRIYTPIEARTELVGITPPIVSESDFAFVQKQLQINRKQKRGLARKEFLLRGFVRCANCGRQFSPHAGNTSPRYVCTSSQLKTINCKTPSLNAREAENLVWNQIVKIAKSTRKLEKLVEQYQRPSNDLERERLKRQRAKAASEIETLVSRMAQVDENLWQKSVLPQIEKKQKEIADIETKLKSLPDEKEQIDIEAIKERLSASDLNNLSFEGKVGILKLFGLQLEFDGSNLKFSYWES